MVSDPAEDIKTLDIEIFEKIVRNDPMMMLYKEAKTDEVIKIFRIFSGNYMEICESEDLYDNTEVGIYNKISLINHACIPNATLHSVSRRLILVREIGTAATELTAHPHAQLHYNTDTDWLAACTA